jgi:hypothetical protein
MPTRLPMTELDIRSIARSHSRSMIAALVSVARQKTAQPGARVAAANSVLDRGWGKADQMHVVDGDIKVTIRHILEHLDDAKPMIVQGKEVSVIDVDAKDDTGQDS